MRIDELLTKTCVIGLMYFDRDGQLMRQAQFAGTVVKVDAEQGISVRLRHAQEGVEQPEFILPPNLDAWFKAPPGRYRHAADGVDIENPDFVVTWNVHRTQNNSTDGQHEWWEWVPNVEPPQVGSAA
ncbi:hypothetical protein [Aquabacterium sp.]|uniref:hypothetical protein n=1 Tax=Aquabacterium sp. TaxID=1872578 RepID=UPI002CD7AB94|nr:hypothetical protein [Aquabacterium sp.]HSW06733.1 hypothetical protein [Aquabacterium sp.]